MKQILLFLIFFNVIVAKANFILLPMDEATQKNHLKAYGITYWALDKQYKASWLLNYRGGSFLLPDVAEIRKECQIRGVSFEILSDSEEESILAEISSPSQNMETVVLEKAPKIAVYSPPGKQPWDDAVTMVLTYAEIPRHDYEIVDNNGNNIGIVTSGTQAPSLNKAIGMGYVKTEFSAIDSDIYIVIRDKKVKAKVVKIPFYKK